MQSKLTLYILLCKIIVVKLSRETVLFSADIFLRIKRISIINVAEVEAGTLEILRIYEETLYPREYW